MAFIRYAGDPGKRIDIGPFDTTGVVDGTTITSALIRVSREGADDEDWDATVIAATATSVTASTITDGTNNAAPGIYRFRAFFFVDGDVVLEQETETVFRFIEGSVTFPDQPPPYDGWQAEIDAATAAAEAATAAVADLEDRVEDLEDGVEVEARDFSTLVSLNSGSYRQTMGAGAGVLGLSSKPYVSGTFCETLVPASVTSLALPPGLPSVGWVQGTACVIRIEATSTTEATASRSVTASPAVIAPTLVVSTQTGDLDQLTLVPSVASQFVQNSLTGTALGGTMATARTLTGIVSGNGTTEIILSLSGELDPGDAATFVLSAGHAFRAMTGPLAANGATDISIIALSTPQLLAAYVPSNDRDRLWLDFDVPVTLESLPGITIDVTTGTTQSVSAYVSGDGTASLVLSLTGDIDTNTVMTVLLAQGAVRSVSAEAPNDAIEINHTWYTTPDDLTGFTMGRVGETVMSGSTWPSAFGDSIVLTTSSGTVANVANGYEGSTLLRFEKAGPDYMAVTTPGSNQVDALTSSTAWNLWAFAIPKSLGTDVNDAAHYNNEGWIGAQGTWGIAVRSGASIGLDSARAQVNHLSGGAAYLATETPIELHTPSCVRGRLAGGSLYARTDLSPTEASKVSSTTPGASGVLIGATSSSANRQADVDYLALVTADQDQPAYKAAGIYGWAQRQQWGGFLRPQPLFPKSVNAVAGQAVSLAWESCILIARPDAITVTTTGVGSDSASGWSWTPAGGDVGDHIVTVTISDATDGRILRVTKFAVHVEAATTTGAVSVLCVGDSNIASAVICTQVRTALNAQGMTCTLVGSLGTPPNLHDGVGGWSWDETLTGQNPDGSPFAGGGAYPTSTYDIAAYIAAEGTPDVVYCHFGTNDVGSYYSTYGEDPDAYIATRLPQVIANAEAFIDAWKAAVPGIIIIVGNPLPINRRQAAFTANYGTGIIRWGMRRMMHRLREAYDAAFANREAEGIYQCALEGVDGDVHFDATNAVHPLSPGLVIAGNQVAATARRALAA